MTEFKNAASEQSITVSKSPFRYYAETITYYKRQDDEADLMIEIQMYPHRYKCQTIGVKKADAIEFAEGLIKLANEPPDEDREDGDFAAIRAEAAQMHDRKLQALLLAPEQEPAA